MTEENRRFLLDTDIVIYWLKNKYPEINRKIKQISRKFIFISSVTVAELYFGAYHSVKKDENIGLIDSLIKKIRIVPFDKKAGKYFGQIKAQLKGAGRIISDSDMFIAATVLSDNFILVTNNVQHFARIENLKIQNWADEFSSPGLSKTDAGKM